MNDLSRREFGQLVLAGLPLSLLRQDQLERERR
jgi:hypothetical protein